MFFYCLLNTLENYFFGGRFVLYEISLRLKSGEHFVLRIIKEVRADGGPTKNKFLMQFQADCLRVPINCSDVEEASALGAVVMNGMARKIWTSFEQVSVLRRSRYRIEPQSNLSQVEKWCEGWLKAVNQLIR